MTVEELDIEEEILLAKAALDAATVEHDRAASKAQRARRWYVSTYNKGYRQRAALFEDHGPIEMSLWIKVTRPLCPDCLMLIQPDDTWHRVTVEPGNVAPTFSCDDGPVLY